MHDHMMVVPAQGGEVAVVVVTTVGAFSNVVGLESVGRTTSVGGAHAAVPPGHVSAGGRRDLGGGVADLEWLAVFGEGDHVDR